MGTTIRKRMMAGIIAVLTVLNFFIIPVAAAEGDIEAGSWADVKSAVAGNNECTIQLTADIKLTADDSALTINGGKNITLDLNGKTIDCSEGAIGNSLITVSGSNSFIGGTTYSYFKLIDSVGGGAISGNNAGRNNGGAVKVGSYGRFTLDGAKITKCTAANGGGIYVAANGVLTIIKGEISYNTTKGLGGGVYLDQDGDNPVCTIYGGSIIYNVAENDSADHSNTSDRGAGIYFGHHSDVNFGKESASGEDEIPMSPIIISGNYDSFTDGYEREDNLYISYPQERNHFIFVNQKLAEGSSIGLCVSFANNALDAQATLGYVKHNGELDANEVFFLDQAERVLIILNGEIHCVKGHVHDLAYSAEGNVLKVECVANVIVNERTRASVKCTQKAELTLEADDAEYTGDPVAAYFTGAAAYKRLTGNEAKVEDIVYFDAEGNPLGNTAPSAVGEYVAKYSVTVGEDTYTIEKSFKITCTHDWDDGVIDPDATCDDPGVKTFTCKKCGTTKTETVDPKGHAYGDWEYSDLDQHKRVCANNSEHVEYGDHDWDNGKVTKVATCEEDGEMTYTCSICGGTKTEKIDAIEHSWSEPDYVWAEDNSTCTATRTCSKCSKEDTLTVNTTVVNVPATCTTAGSDTFTAAFNSTVFADQTKIVNLPAIQHKWGEPTYEWSKDNSECTATRVCANDPTHIETETVQATSEVTKKATCEENGETTYTAVFENPVFGTKTTTDSIPAMTGHDWGEPTYEWSKDNSECTATRVCANDPKDVQTETVKATSEVTKKATCEEDGETTYTAVFTNKAFETQTTKASIPAKTGHDWSEVTYEWSKDNSECTATRVCANDPSHVETETVKATSEVTKQATCEEDGETVYTAVFENPVFETQTTKASIPAKTGHDWGEVTYEWSADNGKVTATRVCKTDKTHVETETVATTSKVTKAATVDAKGVKTFTSDAFKNPAFSVQTKDTDLPRLTPTPTPTLPADDPSVKLKINKANLAIPCGKTDTLKATLIGSSDKITWKSSNTKIATVDANGKIAAKKAGSVMITASAAGKKATCTVQVLFKDVTNSKDFWYTPTYYLTDKKVVKGYDNQTLFKPANICTRAQMVTFIWRLMGQPAPKTTSMKFKDVKKTDYFYQACLWGNENHIVEGYKNGTFGPKINCARRHAVTFLWRLAGKPEPATKKNKFSDLKKSDYFYKATLWASEKKILEGYSDGTFRPNGNCLRRQMVTFLYKYDKFVNGKG